MSTAQRILDLFESDRQKIESIGKAAASALKILSHLQRRPVVSVKALVDSLDLTVPIVNAALRNLETHNIVREITGRQRDRVFAYADYLNLLAEGTEPL